MFEAGKIPLAASQLILTSLVLFSILNKPICRNLAAVCRLGEAPFISRKKSQLFDKKILRIKSILRRFLFPFTAENVYGLSTS